MIWVKREGNYFCEADWTGQITLNRLDKSVFSRERFAANLEAHQSGTCIDVPRWSLSQSI
jgi:hypothetical protein